MKDFLSIGEMSSLFGLNIQTLYYYDSIDIFKPRMRDIKNGRRKYEFDQVYELATICYMRKLGYSLEEISKQRSTQHANSALDSLKQRSEELHRQWKELISIDEAIQRKLRFIEGEMKNIRTDEITVRHFEDRAYLAIGEEEALYRQNSFYFYPTIAFYQGEEKYFGAYLYPSEEPLPDHLRKDQIRRIPAGDFLCGYHLGPYETVPATTMRIRNARPDLHFEDLTINFNILDQFVENQSSGYITHTQIRILKP
ncbi:MerR family transcriptional regulator [Lacrimispora indolis]|uniref:MerR family transcriptional regulator n=1 Tax=Lacrimispora indolis TaxID=69825 RepID=UPI0003F4FA0D|nr:MULTISPECIES: MerR family transcriptional regulator [Lachnospiraceae]MBE7719544.1 MerR family transcriptional regulator [Lacrimispora celerecrescens]